MTKPVSSLASRAVARRMSPSPLTAARRGRRPESGPETTTSRSRPSSAGATNTSDLTNLFELRADGRGGFLGRVGRLVEDRDLERDALAGCGVDDAPSLDDRGSRARRGVSIGHPPLIRTSAHERRLSANDLGGKRRHVTARVLCWWR